MNGPLFWFSENGDHLSFVSVNDTAVPEVNLPIYSDPDSFHLYTEKVMIRFPTVGTSFLVFIRRLTGEKLSSDFSLCRSLRRFVLAFLFIRDVIFFSPVAIVADPQTQFESYRPEPGQSECWQRLAAAAQSARTVSCPLCRRSIIGLSSFLSQCQSTFDGNGRTESPALSSFAREYYLTSAQWVTNQRICAVWTVRAQNLSLISFCDAGPWHCQTVRGPRVGGSSVVRPPIDRISNRQQAAS